MGGDGKCGRCSRLLGGNPCVLEDDVLLDFMWVGWLVGRVVGQRDDALLGATKRV